MSKKCIEGVFSFIKSEEASSKLKNATQDLKKKDIKSLVNQIKNTARNMMVSDTTLSREHALQKATDLKMEELKQGVEKERKGVRINKAAKAKQKAVAEGLDWDAKKIESAWFSGRLHKGTGVRNGIDDSITAYTAQILHTKGAIVPELEKIGGIKALGNLETQYKVADQILKQSFSDDLVGKIAKVVDKHNGHLLRLQHEAGLDTPELVGRISRQYHNAQKILRPKDFHTNMMKELGIHHFNMPKYLAVTGKMSSQALDKMQRDVAFRMWHSFMRPKLDMRLSLLDVDHGNEDDITKAMRDTFDKITNPYKDPSRLEMDEPTSSLSDRISNQQRHYFYKDGKSWVDYSREYGAGNILDAIEREAHSMSHTLAMTHAWGVNPKQNYLELRENFLDKTDKSTVRNVQKMDKEMAYLIGQTRPDAQTWLGSFAKGAQTWNTIKGLGMVVPRSISDTALQWATLSHWGETFPGKVQATVRSFTSGKNDEELKDLYSSMGVMSKHMIGNRHVIDPRQYRGIGTKLEALENKLNYLTWWDQSMKKGVFAGLASHLAKHSDVKFEDLNPKIKKHFDLYAIKPSEWDAWRKGATRLEDGVKYLSPHAVLDSSDKDVLNTLEEGDIKLSPNQIRGQLYNKFLAMFNGQYKYVVPGGGIEARAMRAYHNTGTIGNLVNLFMQFKSYAIGYVRDVLGRDIGMADSKYHAFKNLSSRVVSSAALGMVGVMAVNFLKNESLPDMDPFDSDPKKAANARYNWYQSILGSLGIIGSGMSALSSSSGDMVSQLLGPTASDINNTQKYFHEMYNHATNNKRSYQKKSAALITEEFAKKNMPFANTPVAAYVINHWVGRYIMDAIQYGSYEQHVHTMKQKHGVTPMFK